MKKSEIPRFGLETFAQTNFKVPFLNVEQYPIGGSYFVIKNRDHHPVNDYISPNRRQFFKIFHITSGTGILTVGLHQYVLSAGNIAFLHPNKFINKHVLFNLYCRKDGYLFKYQSIPYLTLPCYRKVIQTTIKVALS